MSTTIRPEVSAKNKYVISKHRYYELKHFVMQYPEWKEKIKEIDGYARQMGVTMIPEGEKEPSDPTNKWAEEREYYLQKICTVDLVAEKTDPIIGKQIVQAVIIGLSYDAMNTKFRIPCCKDVYYDLYRKFFWLLDSARR